MEQKHQFAEDLTVSIKSLDEARRDIATAIRVSTQGLITGSTVRYLSLTVP